MFFKGVSAELRLLVTAVLTLLVLNVKSSDVWSNSFSNQVAPAANANVSAPNWSRSTENGRPVLVYDHLIPYETAVALQAYVEIQKLWKFRSRENGIPWKADYDIDYFLAGDDSSSPPKVLIPSLTESIEALAGNGLTYQPYEIGCYIVRRGDATMPHRDSEEGSTHGGEYTAWLYLNQVWKDNDYGQLQFFDEDGKVLAVVGPRFGRVVLWESSISYLSRPPSINYKHGQVIFAVRFTANVTKPAAYKRAWRAEIEARKSEENSIFSPTSWPTDDEPFDVAKHVVQISKSAKDQKIILLDELYNETMLDKLRLFILNYGTYYYDDSTDLENDNVQWIAGFFVDEFVQSLYWHRLKQVVEAVSGTEGWFPYDVSCNLVRHSDFTRTHADSEVGEDEWTFVLYLTPDWTSDLYGETVFLEDATSSSEYITAVWPGYGRAVIFQNLILHSARPPSTKFTGARLTFAVKMSISEEVARVKIAREQFGHEEGLDAFYTALHGELFSGEKESQGEISSDQEDKADQELIDFERFLHQHKSDSNKLKQYYYHLFKKHLKEQEVVLSIISNYV